MDIPEWKWDGISMNFVMSLPKTSKGNDSIWVVADRLTLAHFIPIKTSYSLQKLAEVYIKKVVSLYDIPSSIVSNRDLRSHQGSGGVCRKPWVLS